jgi:hypothetical protein
MRWGLRAFSFVFALCCATAACAQYYGGPLLFFGSAGVVPIGTPISLGTNSSAASIGSLTITTGTNIQAGDLVVIAIAADNGANDVSGVSDGTNTYARAQSGLFNSVLDGELWYKCNAAAVSSGASLTVSFSVNSTATAIAASRISGITPTSCLDVAPSATINNAATTSCSIASGTLAKANEILVGYVYANGGPAITEGAGFNTISNVTIGGNIALDYASQTVAATGSKTYAPTFASNKNMCMIISFKGN